MFNKLVKPNLRASCETTKPDKHNDCLLSCSKHAMFCSEFPCWHFERNCKYYHVNCSWKNSDLLTCRMWLELHNSEFQVLYRTCGFTTQQACAQPHSPRVLVLPSAAWHEDCRSEARTHVGTGRHSPMVLVLPSAAGMRTAGQN